MIRLPTANHWVLHRLFLEAVESSGGGKGLAASAAAIKLAASALLCEPDAFFEQWLYRQPLEWIFWGFLSGVADITCCVISFGGFVTGVADVIWSVGPLGSSAILFIKAKVFFMILFSNWQGLLSNWWGLLSSYCIKISMFYGDQYRVGKSKKLAALQSKISSKVWELLTDDVVAFKLVLQSLEVFFIGSAPCQPLWWQPGESFRLAFLLSLRRRMTHSFWNNF